MKLGELAEKLGGVCDGDANLEITTLGTLEDAGAALCVACPAGKASSVSTDACVECPNGRVVCGRGILATMHDRC